MVFLIFFQCIVGQVEMPSLPSSFLLVYQLPSFCFRGRILVGNLKINSYLYADDLLIISNNPVGFNGMLILLKNIFNNGI